VNETAADRIEESAVRYETRFRATPAKEIRGIGDLGHAAALTNGRFDAIVFRDMQFVPPADLADRNSSWPHHEWVRGRYYPKVSPKWAHGLLQVRVAVLLSVWAEGRGALGSETDTNVTPKRGDTRRYLPDVGFWSFRRLREASERA
jgi:hypothetical protein